MSFAKGKYNPLDKKVPENPRYKHVKPVVDSGASMNKYYERLDEIKRNYKFRKNEIFRRIKCPTFVQLVLQIVGVGIEEGQLLEECPIHSSNEATPPHRPHPSPPSTARSTLSDLVSGVGELDVSNPDSSPFSTPPHQSPCQLSPLATPSVCPYLLLDVRETESYDKCHIITARSYPARMLSRSVNPYTRELFQYKNKPEHIIVVYDEDETVAHEVATKLVQRDFDNVFMLSGGLKVLYKSFPRGIVTGAVPPSCRPSPIPPGRKRSSVHPMVYEPSLVRDFFTVDDLLFLQQRLDEVLLASSTAGSSRTSSRSSVTSLTSRSSRVSSTRPASQKTWKY